MEWEAHVTTCCDMWFQVILTRGSHDFALLPVMCGSRWPWQCWREGWFKWLWLDTCDMLVQVILTDERDCDLLPVRCGFGCSLTLVVHMTVTCYLWHVVSGVSDTDGSWDSALFPVMCCFRWSWQWWWERLWLVTCKMWFQVFLTLVVHMTVPCYLQHVVSHDPDSGDERDYDVLPVRCGFRCFWHLWFTRLWLVTCDVWFHVFLTLVVDMTVTC